MRFTDPVINPQGSRFLLEASDLSHSYGDLKALEGFGIEIPQGQITALVGLNGAGKTTALRLLTGSLPLRSGKVLIMGHDITQTPQEAFRYLGTLPEGAPAWPDAIAIDALRYVAGCHCIFSDAQFTECLKSVSKVTNLSSILHKRIDQLSKGMRRRLSLAMALIHDPALLILDEPSDGLDPYQRKLLHSSITSLSKDRGVLISTHDLSEVQAICHNVMVLHQGRVVARGSPAQIISQAGKAKAGKAKLGGKAGLDLEGAFLSLTGSADA